MLKTLIKASLWILAFVPLVVDNKVFFPFISGKNLLIQSCLILAGVLFLINYFYSKDFRGGIMEKVTKYLKHPLVLSVLAFVFVSIASAIFAVDKYTAFWGELSRAEGLSGLIFFSAFYILALLSFEKKDWLWFFKLSLFASLILLGKEFWEFFSQNILRPGSFTGNPMFLAGYLLFSITSALIVFNEEKNKIWKVLSIIILILSIAGIFIAQTRGALLGLGFGIFTALIYCVVRGQNIFYKKISLRKISVVILCLVVLFSTTFVITRSNHLWQKVPGLSRLAVVNVGDGEDPSTQIRLYIYKSALQSINPVQNGWGKFLIGWGPDNFIIADSQYYYSEQYKYEQRWYDRAHNKILDILVMNGIMGLLAYLAIWISFFAVFFRRKLFSITDIGLILFGVSYFIHLMFAFDQISAYIPFFSVLAFRVYFITTPSPEALKKPLITPKTKDKYETLIGLFLVIQVVFLCFIYFKNTLPSYIQMRDYTYFIKNTQTISFGSKIDSVFSPFTNTQINIRRNFIEVASKLYDKNPDEISLGLLDKAIVKSEEYLLERPKDFQFMVTLADLYLKEGKDLKNPDYLKRGEELLRNVLTFAPNRPDINLKLALNLSYQEKYLESFDISETAFSWNPILVESDRNEFEVIYTRFIKFFYKERNKENFIKTADRLRANNYANMVPLDQIIQYLNTKGVWPKVDFK